MKPWRRGEGYWKEKGCKTHAENPEKYLRGLDNLQELLLANGRYRQRSNIHGQTRRQVYESQTQRVTWLRKVGSGLRLSQRKRRPLHARCPRTSPQLCCIPPKQQLDFSCPVLATRASPSHLEAEYLSSDVKQGSIGSQITGYYVL